MKVTLTFEDDDATVLTNVIDLVTNFCGKHNIEHTKSEIPDVNLIMLDLNGGDFAFYFVNQNLYDELCWSEGMVFEDYVDKVADLVGKAVEENDTRILKTIYCQRYCQDGHIKNFTANIKDILVLES